MRKFTYFATTSIRIKKKTENKIVRTIVSSMVSSFIVRVCVCEGLVVERVFCFSRFVRVYTHRKHYIREKNTGRGTLIPDHPPVPRDWWRSNEDVRAVHIVSAPGPIWRTSMRQRPRQFWRGARIREETIVIIIII